MLQVKGFDTSRRSPAGAAGCDSTSVAAAAADVAVAAVPGGGGDIGSAARGAAGGAPPAHKTGQLKKGRVHEGESR